MGSNVWNNAVFILIVLFFLMSLVIVYTIGNRMNTVVQTAIKGASPQAVNQPYTQKYSELKNFFLVNVQFLLYIIVLLVAYTSFINSSDIRTYFMGALAGTIVTVIVLQVGQLIWNQFSTYNTLLDFSDFAAGNLWFVSNFQTILIINLLASFASFVFIGKPRQAEVGF